MKTAFGRFTAKRISALTVLVLLGALSIENAFSKDIWLSAFKDTGRTYLKAGAVTVHAEVSIQVGNDDLGLPNPLTHGSLRTLFVGSDSGQIASLTWGSGPLESGLEGGPVLVSGSLALGQTDVWAYTFTFYNPTDQYVNISTQGGWAYSIGPFLSRHGNSEFTFKIAPGHSNIIGGDSPPGAPPTPTGTPPPVTRGNNVHAVIISGLSDPTKIVASQNVTLTGGVIALGKDPSPPSTPHSWSSGLRIVPDEALLTGAKIPPLTPNIIDVRIVKHEVVGDLAKPSVSPSP
jgi:hypothetical protein